MTRTVDDDLSAARWRKSSRSSGGGSNCVEVAVLSGRVAIRDSKDADGGAVVVSAAVFGELIEDVKCSRLDSRASLPEALPGMASRELIVKVADERWTT